MFCLYAGMLLLWIITNVVYWLETHLLESVGDLMPCTKLLFFVSMKQVACFHVHILQLSGELSFTVAVLLRQNATKMQVCVRVVVCVKERERGAGDKQSFVSSAVGREKSHLSWEEFTF